MNRDDHRKRTSERQVSSNSCPSNAEDRENADPIGASGISITGDSGGLRPTTGDSGHGDGQGTGKTSPRARAKAAGLRKSARLGSIDYWRDAEGWPHVQGGGGWWSYFVEGVGWRRLAGSEDDALGAWCDAVEVPRG